MSNPTLLHTLRIELSDAAVWLSRKLSILLEREIICEATADDYDYWALKCTNDRFSLADLCKLLSYVNASKEMAEWAIPSDANSTFGIDVKLCNALLQDILHTGWEEQLVQDDAVYLIGVSQETLSFPPSFPGILQIGSLRIRVELLWRKDELLEALGKDGNNYSALANLSGRNLDLFGNELYWHYPISDDLHTGVYFVLVREGVLEYKECDRTLLRVIIPDRQNRFPDERDCELPYAMQLMETDAFNLFEGHEHETEGNDGK